MAIDQTVLAQLSDRGNGRKKLKLIRGGKLAYIWAGDDDPYGGFFGSFSGPARLRAFAEAILAELDRPRQRGKKADTAATGRGRRT